MESKELIIFCVLLTFFFLIFCVGAVQWKEDSGEILFSGFLAVIFVIAGFVLIEIMLKSINMEVVFAPYFSSVMAVILLVIYLFSTKPIDSYSDLKFCVYVLLILGCATFIIANGVLLGNKNTNLLEYIKFISVMSFGVGGSLALEIITKNDKDSKTDNFIRAVYRKISS